MATYKTATFSFKPTMSTPYGPGIKMGDTIYVQGKVPTTQPKPPTDTPITQPTATTEYKAPKVPSVKDIVNEILKSQEKRIKEQTSYLDKYTAKNPFVFDEQLAKQSATAEYEPYYTELLQDYLKGVDLKKSTIQDERKLQSELKSYDTGKMSRDYIKAVTQAEEGFAGKGMFFSGIKDRNIGEMEVENVAGKEKLDTQYGARETNLQRQEQAINLDQQMKQRDVEREKQTAIEGGILTRKEEAMKPYYNTLVSDYTRRFGNSGSNVLAGYLPPDYLRY